MSMFYIFFGCFRYSTMFTLSINSLDLKKNNQKDTFYWNNVDLAIK